MCVKEMERVCEKEKERGAATQSAAPLNLLPVKQCVEESVCVSVYMVGKVGISTAQSGDEDGLKYHPDDSFGGGPCNCCSLFVFLRCPGPKFHFSPVILNFCFLFCLSGRKSSLFVKTVCVVHRMDPISELMGGEHPAVILTAESEGGKTFKEIFFFFFGL